MNQYSPVSVCFSILLCVSVAGAQRRYYSREWRTHWKASGNWPNRIYNLMKERYEDSKRKIEFIHDIQFSYEESPQYEMGFVMGDIMDRYKKMVENIKRGVMVKSDAIGVTIKRLGFVMDMYFEIYHLVNMMHEIPHKYGLSEDMKPRNDTSETVTVAFDNNQGAHEAQDKLERDKRERERKRKQRIREMNKMRELMLKGKYQTQRTRKPQNKWWPIDYGWEIDYYW